MRSQSSCPHIKYDCLQYTMELFLSCLSLSTVRELLFNAGLIFCDDRPAVSSFQWGGGPRVVVSTAAFHARVRGSVPGLGGLKETKLFLPHPRVKVSIVGSLRDREVACSASDRQGSNFESCVWRTVSSQSSHHPQEVLLAQFSLYVHKGGLKPESFHFYHFNVNVCSGTVRWWQVGLHSYTIYFISFAWNRETCDEFYRFTYCSWDFFLGYGIICVVEEHPLHELNICWQWP